MKHYIYIILAAALLLYGCSKPEGFTIEGSVKGAGAQTVTLTYFADGGIKKETVAMKNGRFAIHAKSASPTLGILSIAPENVRLATMIVGDGDHLSVDADMANPLATTVEGNSDSEAVAKWINENAATLASRDAEAINRAVGNYVVANKSSRAAMAVLSGFFQTEGYESRADSLFSQLAPEVRKPEMAQGFNNVITATLGSRTNAALTYMTLYERRDSFVHVNPNRHSTTLICFVDERHRTSDSVGAALDSLTDKYARKRLMAVEISTAPDSASWRESLPDDTVRWPQAWLPGSLANQAVRRLGVTRVPYFVAADSSGKIAYRGASLTKARESVEGIINRYKE